MHINRTFLSAKEAVCPPLTSLTGNLFRCIPLIATGMNSPRKLGPNSNVSFKLITPCIHVPDTTVPTPWIIEMDSEKCFNYKINNYFQ